MRALPSVGVLGDARFGERKQLVEHLSGAFATRGREGFIAGFNEFDVREPSNERILRFTGAFVHLNDFFH